MSFIYELILTIFYVGYFVPFHHKTSVAAYCIYLSNLRINSQWI